MMAAAQPAEGSYQFAKVGERGLVAVTVPPPAPSSVFALDAAGTLKAVPLGESLSIVDGELVATSTGGDWGDITNTPTTLAGYGITDPVALTNGSYSNPAWITALAWSKLSGTPTTLAGYGIADSITAAAADAAYAAISHTHAFSAITSKPTTLAGYGITDPVAVLGAAQTFSDIQTIKAIKLNSSDGAYLRDGYEATGDAAQKGRLVWGADGYGVSMQVSGAVASLSKVLAGNGVGSPYYAGEIVMPASHQWHFRSGTSATHTALYNTYTDATQYEAFAVDWQTTTNVAMVGTTKGASGGTAREWALIHGGVEKARVSAAGLTVTSGDGDAFKVQNGGTDRFKISTTSTAGSLWVGHASYHAFEGGGNTWVYSYSGAERCRMVFGEDAYSLLVRANTTGNAGVFVANSDHSAAYLAGDIRLNTTVGTFTVEPRGRDAAGGYTGPGHAALFKGGNGQSTGTGAAGGAATMQGGNAGGSGDNHGGDVTIKGGNPTGSGTRGVVYVGDGSGAAVVLKGNNAEKMRVDADGVTVSGGLAASGGVTVGTGGSAISKILIGYPPRGRAGQRGASLRPLPRHHRRTLPPADRA